LDTWDLDCKCYPFFLHKCRISQYDGKESGFCPYDCIGKDFNKGESCGCDLVSLDGCLCKFNHHKLEKIKNWLETYLTEEDEDEELSILVDKLGERIEEIKTESKNVIEY
jgi:hypothetical protein